MPPRLFDVSALPRPSGLQTGRRPFVLALGAGFLAAACGRASDARPPPGSRVVRVGMLRISPHLMAPKFYQRFLPPDVFVETIAFNNSTEIKTAIVTGSIDFCVTGVTAALQGASRGEPFRILAAAADGASAIVVRNDENINSVADLRGKAVGYVPGSAQDILLRLSLREQGLDAAKDVRLLKVGFGDMANALERGDIDAFTGAETGPSVALLRGSSKVLLYPYETKMGKINIVFGTRQQMVDQDPDRCRTMVVAHAKATDYMKAHPDEWAAATIKTWGASIEAVRLAIANISLRWEIDDAYVQHARALGEQLELLKQVKRQPNYEALFETRFVRPLKETLR
ncbi:MAG: ABC transporter substrate-binding protein [Myxococcota bacterium]|nr:ABC transporter substrate-binding protein [Myxococcota bacterium]